MANYDMEMVLTWAKVFPENVDMGDPNGGKAAKKIAQKGGQYIVNAYFTDENQIKQLLEDGLDPLPMNHKRIVEGDADFGIGKYMKIKRMVDDVRVFTNKRGEEITRDFGGPPKVVDLRDGVESKRLWSVEEDGFLGNGTRSRVQFETYSSGAGVRLLNLGILNLVEYENISSGDADWVVPSQEDPQDDGGF